MLFAPLTPACKVSRISHRSSLQAALTSSGSCSASQRSAPSASHALRCLPSPDLALHPVSQKRTPTRLSAYMCQRRRSRVSDPIEATVGMSCIALPHVSSQAARGVQVQTRLPARLEKNVCWRLRRSQRTLPPCPTPSGRSWTHFKRPSIAKIWPLSGQPGSASVQTASTSVAHSIETSSACPPACLPAPDMSTNRHNGKIDSASLQMQRR